MTGRIVKIVSNQYTVQNGKERYLCQARGKLRLIENSPVVGDQVDFDEKKKVITKIEPRINEFKRPVVANIYGAIVVSSLKKPDLDLYLLDKMLITIEKKCSNIIILFTKIDLCNPEEKKLAEQLKEYYEKLNYTVYFNNDPDAFITMKKDLQGQVVTLVGQSGAGKSTFLNKLSPSLNLATSPISTALNRGVHTTRHVELYDIEGIFFVDTPGFSALDLDMTPEELKLSFREFLDYSCKYRDCNHDQENNCSIKQNVKAGKILTSRYNNYLLFKKEIYENSRKLYK